LTVDAEDVTLDV